MINFEVHSCCHSLSTVFQGGLCEKLTSRPARTYLGDQVIYHMGDEAHSIYFLRQGLVKINALSKTGKELILALHKSGEIFGEFCFCDDRRNEMAVAMEESEIVEIKFEEILVHIQNNRDALLTFLVSVTKRLSRSYQLLCEHSFDTLSERLSKVLLRLGDEVGQQTSRGVELEHHITQEELAQMVSARREVVSSELCRMRERGYITYDRGGKFTIDRVALTAYLEGGTDRVDEVVRRRERMSAPRPDSLGQSGSWANHV
ncbi:MAG TPA: Crp/Fnr family transcriptional regulator, partial [Blastocatellia bacterium]|nr:Crp/Fnr family transcriptional regulator [Blastocatellia bacterium]